MNPKISVIVPVYNTEDYLEECFDSISLQTYKNFEVIVVDDGSTDRSGDICDSYANKDKRFKIIHKINEGVSIARNIALEKISGDYICFVDSDDTIEKDMLKSFLELIDEYQADIIFSDREICKENTKITSPICLNQKQARENFFQQGLIRPSLWLGIFKSDLFKDIRFPSNIVHYEDYAVIARILGQINKVVVTGNRFYNYRIRIDSATHKLINNKMMSCLLINDYLSENNAYINKQERIDVISFFIFFLCSETFKNINSEYTNIVKNKIKTNFKEVIYSKSLSIKIKFIVLLYCISPHLAMYSNSIHFKYKQYCKRRNINNEF